MSTYRDQAIVLAVRPIRDADRHYIAFTERHGKVKLLAKGTRRGRSKMSPHLGGFGVSEIMVARGRLVDRLAGANLVRPFTGVAATLDKSLVAQSFGLAVDALTRHDLPDGRIFQLLVEFLETLERREVEVSSRPRLFDAGIVKLVDRLGFGLELDACIRCRRRLDPDGNGLHVPRGGIECRGCRGVDALNLSAEAIKVLRFWRDEPLVDVARLRLEVAVRRETARVVDWLLTSHLEDRLPALAVLQAATA